MSTTTQPIGAAPVSALPEFADHKSARRLFSLPRSSLYKLADEGKIKSVSLRQPGALRGKRLFDCESIRLFLRRQMEAAK